jgi:hypothetical protein
MKNSTFFLFVLVLFVSFLIETTNAQALIFNTGKMQVRVDSYGAMRFWTIEGPDTIQHLNRVNILVAGNPNQVLDYYNDTDIEVPNSLVASPTTSDYEISAVYNNAYSNAPPNVLIAQNVYGWQDGGYIIVKMVVTNNESSAIPTIIGLDVVQRVDFTWENDNVFWDAANEMLVQYENHYVGIKYLSEPVTSAQVIVWYDGYSSDDATTYAHLTDNTFDTDTLLTDADGSVAFLAGQTVTLQPNESRTLYIAVAAGANETEMLANMQAAQQKYGIFTSVEGIESTPSSYALDQNYPNPFNPSTKISYQLPQSGFVSLKVYNAIGKEVTTLVNEEKSAGRYEVNFDATGLTSGVYFYTITANNFTQTNKMLLIK